MRATIHLQIEGRVQGVGYRVWVAREAERRGLDGWARNRADGSVEAVFAGERDAVAAIMQACRRGPATAIVVTVTEIDAVADPGPGFRVLPTER